MKKREKVPYTDELADAIIAANNLRPLVKKVWKSRGHIPGDYLDENRDDSQKLRDTDPEYRRFIEILSRPEIAASKFRTYSARKTECPRQSASASRPRS